jgi:hypothetical protein
MIHSCDRSIEGRHSCERSLVGGIVICKINSRSDRGGEEGGGVGSAVSIISGGGVPVVNINSNIVISGIIIIIVIVIIIRVNTRVIAIIVVSVGVQVGGGVVILVIRIIIRSIGHACIDEGDASMIHELQASGTVVAARENVDAINYLRGHG